MKLFSVILAVIFLNLPECALAQTAEKEERWAVQKPYDVFGIGAATVDSYFKVSDDEFKKILGIPFGLKRGEMIDVDRSTFDELLEKKQPLAVLPSDSAANIVTNLALFGAKVSYNAIVNDDKFGREFIASLEKAGVMNYIKPKYFAGGTSRGLVYITPDGERTIITYSGAHEDMSQLDIKYHVIKDFKVVFVEAAIWDKSGKLSKTALRSYNIAEKVGTVRAFSLHDVYFINKHRSEFQELLKYTDIVFGNEFEARALFNTHDLKEVIAKFQKSVKIAVITQASKGALVVTPEKVIKISRAPIKSIEAVDTSGAGDAFAAGFLFGYVSGHSLEECGRLASFSAREVLKSVGPQPDRSFKEVYKDLF